MGKSTTAANLALALAAEGASVGVLDADIYGPSQPMMLGINRRPESDDGKTMEPLENYGVQVMSIGFLVDQDEAMIWRGPMATRRWSSCCARPTGKTWTTSSSTCPRHRRHPAHAEPARAHDRRGDRDHPQDIALLDAKKGIKMFERWVCPSWHRREHGRPRAATAAMWSTSLAPMAARKMAAEYGMDYLGALPLNMSIRLQADSGKPTVVADPDGEVARHLQEGGARCGGEDRPAGQGLFQQVPHHLDQQEHLILPPA